MEIEQPKIDDNLYSRQIATYGAEAMGKLVKLRVLLVGLQGVGIETAKNLVLAGPKSVHIVDNNKVQMRDLGSNFFSQESHVGKSTRAESSVSQLKELNPLVDVQAITQEVGPQLYSQYDVVAFTDFYNREKLIEADTYLRENSKGFIYTGNLGLYGFAFVDFGKEHIVFDTDGVNPRNSIVVNITNDTEAIVTTHEDKRHGFSDGDTVTFREVEGMSEINGQKYKIKDVKQHSFVLEGCNSTEFKAYTGQGIVEQVKVPTPFEFKSFEKSLQEPFAPGKNEIDLLDWEKFGVPEQLHLILNGVLEFASQNNHTLPRLHNQQDAQKLVEIVNKINTENKASSKVTVESFSKGFIENVALFANTNLSPIASFWGGIVAQEIIKFTGKYTPLRQWLHHEIFEALPENATELKNNVPKGSRYDDYIAVYGEEFVDKMQRQKSFMIGAGALGCEYLKMFSLMGLSTKGEGKLTVTDDDQIEVSNLNRQFLFRRDNVGKSKSECAANAVKTKMNPDFNVDAKTLRVCPETEEQFNDHFWNGLDFVVNAVDNVKARLFVDGRCVWFQKALFEAGTLGTQCNAQVIIPKCTQSYGDSVDPPEEGIPLCTLKNFPNQIEHCIQYSRDKFEEYLVDGPNECIKYIQDQKKYIQETSAEYSNKPGIFRAKLETVKKLSKAYLGGRIEDLIELGRNLWAENFHNQIASLLNAYPVDAKTSEGAPFWSGPKRAPQILDFDSSDEQSLLFVQSFANILAHVFGIPQCNDAKTVKEIVSKIEIPKFVPKKIQIKVDEKDKTEEKSEDDDQIISNLLEELQNLKISQKGQLNPIEFEKDDPTNWHIEFVSSMANLRARNYKIKEVSPFQVKIIAGKIIPALATTTAMVVGALGMEIIKYLLGKPVSQMRNSFMNLALPLFLFSEPLPPIESKDKDYDEVLMGPVKAIPPNFTTWDKITVVGPMTLQQFIDHIKEKYNVDSSIISSGKTCMYNSYSSDSSEKLSWDVSKIITESTGQQVPDYKLFLEIEVCGEIDGIDATMPTIKYAYKGL